MKKIFKKLSLKDSENDINLQSQELEEEYDDFEEEEEIEEEEEQEEAEDETEDENDQEEWGEEGLEEEGQLSIDVYQTPKAIVVKSTIAGVKPEDIDISINNDMLTIRGKREIEKEVKDAEYLLKECYWGSFSRSVILPVEIEADKIEAELENGVLTVVLPKAKPAKQISIKVKSK